MEISERTLKYIQEQANGDTNAIRLKYHGKHQIEEDIQIDFALLQIEARRKCSKKLPTFLKDPLFMFPDAISAEQASNEAVARYHASLIQPGASALDLTAGLGIDDLTYAAKGIYVTACEIDNFKSEVLVHNSNALGLDGHLKVLNTDSMIYVENCCKKFDVVYADPARRSESGNRVHALSDCQPDIIRGMSTIMKVTDRMLVKSSPLLDLTSIRETLEKLYHIHIVCFKGECKEVLIEIENGKQFSGITVVDLDNNGIISKFQCHRSPIQSEANIKACVNKSPLEYKYLYEPNSGVMKTGAWGELSLQFPELQKADINTHIFFSDTLYEAFPGRTLTMSGHPDKKGLKRLHGTKCNVVARNYPLSATEVAKKYKLIPGGDRFLYAFRYMGKPICVTAETVNKDLKVQG